MLKIHFPTPVRVKDADGIERTCHTMGDIVKLYQEKRDRYNDSEADRFIKEVARAVAPPFAPAPKPDETPPATVEAVKAAGKTPAPKAAPRPRDIDKGGITPAPSKKKAAPAPKSSAKKKSSRK